MAIGVLVEALLPGSGGTNGAAGKPPPKDGKVWKNGSETNSQPWTVYQEH